MDYKAYFNFIIKAKAKNFIRKFGYDVRKYHPANSLDAQREILLKTLKISNVIDIGANEGQYGRTLRATGFRGSILSFEPSADAHQVLIQSVAGDRLWHVAERMAIGGEEGVKSLNVSKNSVSSSLLAVRDSHIAAAPESVVTRRENICVKRLDDVVGLYIDLGAPTYLKVDTQGYEWEVLRGAQKVLAGAVAVEIELSLVPLYDGQVLMEGISSRLSSAGYTLWGVWPEFAMIETGRVLQVNGVFVRD